jgi:hypothetical protein
MKTVPAGFVCGSDLSLRWPAPDLSDAREALVASDVCAGIARLRGSARARGVAGLQALFGSFGTLVRWSAVGLERAPELLGVDAVKVCVGMWGCEWARGYVFRHVCVCVCRHVGGVSACACVLVGLWACGDVSGHAGMCFGMCMCVQRGWRCVCKCTGCLLGGEGWGGGG